MNITNGRSLGIDIGGTFIKSALVDVAMGRLASDELKLDTPKPATPEAIMNRLREIRDHFRWEGSIGIGFPGVVKSGVIHTAVHLDQDWLGVNMEKLLRSVTTAPSTVINDADAAGLAEMRFGAGMAHRSAAHGIVLVITLGTGIGSALFVNGRLIPNTEFGHIYTEDGIEVESLAAASMREKYQMSWEEWGDRVNRYLLLLEKIVSPDLIILGGGVIEAWAQFAPFLTLRSRIAPATLGNHAGLIGAVCSDVPDC